MADTELHRSSDPGGAAKPVCSALSLFAGCGGSDIGLATAGVDVLWANEKYESACAFYRSVTGRENIAQGDIASVKQFPRADLLVGCYPCQGYSQGGSRNPVARINYLYREFDRAVRKVKPAAFIVENVDGMRFSQNRALLDNQLVRFRLAGYSVAWQVLDAKDYGVAQTRRRLFIVGIRSCKRLRYDFPNPTHGPLGRQPCRTQKDAIWRLRHSLNGTYNDEPFHWYYLSRNRRREWNEPAATVVARDRHIALHPDSPPLEKIGNDAWRFVESDRRPRRLSYLECAALQGFPDPCAFNEQSLTLRYRAIGNAVPPPLFAVVTTQLLQILKWI
jgi:DNA (cytosine-5)-methyltransferase 1